MSLHSRLFWLFCFLFLAGCDLIQNGDMPSPTSGSETGSQGEVISLTTEDAIKLSGTWYPASGDSAVVLAHMGIADQTSWASFAVEVAEAGMPVLTFDFRCFGKSECTATVDGETNLVDVRAAIKYLHDKDYQRIACVGASMGGAACLNASMQENLTGLAFIAGPSSFLLNGKLYPDDIVNPGMPKLFMTGDQDVSIIIFATQHYYDISPDPKKLILYPEAAHGTDIFSTPSGEKFRQDLMDFLLAIP